MIKLQPLFIDTKTGNYVSKDIKEPGLCTKQFVQELPSDVWIIPTKMSAIIINIFVDNSLIMPNKITLLPESQNIVVEFSEELIGIANLIYLVEDYTECAGVFDARLLSEAGINIFSINDSPVNN